MLLQRRVDTSYLETSEPEQRSEREKIVRFTVVHLCFRDFDKNDPPCALELWHVNPLLLIALSIVSF